MSGGVALNQGIALLHPIARYKVMRQLKSFIHCSVLELLFPPHLFNPPVFEQISFGFITSDLCGSAMPKAFRPGNCPAAVGLNQI